MKKHIAFIVLVFYYSFCFSNSPTSITSSNLKTTNPLQSSKLTRFIVVPIHPSLVKIEWEIIDDPKIDHFIVQRSSSTEEWSTIAKVNREKTKDPKLRYSTNDLEPEYGINYYNLIIVYLSGKQEFSQVRIAKIGNSGSPTVAIYSSPKDQDITSNSRSESLVSIKVYEAETSNIASSESSEEKIQTEKASFNTKLKNQPLTELKVDPKSTRGVARKQ